MIEWYFPTDNKSVVNREKLRPTSLIIILLVIRIEFLECLNVQTCSMVSAQEALNPLNT